MENIYVWSFDNTLCNWVLKLTYDYKGTVDEYNYFRVIRDGVKSFYTTIDDYLKHKEEWSFSVNKNICVWNKNEYGKFVNTNTDLNIGTGDELKLYSYNTGKNKQYYYSYSDFLEHQYENDTFYKK